MEDLSLLPYSSSDSPSSSSESESSESPGNEDFDDAGVFFLVDEGSFSTTFARWRKCSVTQRKMLKATTNFVERTAEVPRLLVLRNCTGRTTFIVHAAAAYLSSHRGSIVAIIAGEAYRKGLLTGVLESFYEEFTKTRNTCRTDTIERGTSSEVRFSSSRGEGVSSLIVLDSPSDYERHFEPDVAFIHYSATKYNCEEIEVATANEVSRIVISVR